MIILVKIKNRCHHLFCKKYFKIYLYFSVYDVVFHPDTLYLAAKDGRMKGLVHSTAFDALESSFQVKVDRSQVRLPKLSFKGVFRPTVIRKPLATAPESNMADNVQTSASAERCPPPPEAAVPSYNIRYRSNVDLQDFVIKERNLVRFSIFML